MESQKKFTNDFGLRILAQVDIICNIRFLILQGYRYTDEEYLFCITIWKRSKRCYNFINAQLKYMPSIKSLKLYLQKAPIHPGRNESIYRSLTEKLKERKSDRQKFITLIWDEMAIQPNYSYISYKGNIVGVEDWGMYFDNVSKGWRIHVRINMLIVL